MKRKTSLINVEEDGDDVFPKFPKTCCIAKCNRAKLKKGARGFWICANCGSSYGRKY